MQLHSRHFLELELILNSKYATTFRYVKQQFIENRQACEWTALSKVKAFNELLFFFSYQILCIISFDFQHFWEPKSLHAWLHSQIL